MRRNFTLIELLITIAIIVILAGMLLPALGKARARAKNTGCVNNLKQWGTVFHSYYMAFDDYTIPYDGGRREDGSGGAWNAPGSFCVMEVTGGTVPVAWSKRRDQWMYTGPDISICPAINPEDKKQGTNGGNSRLGYQGYGMWYAASWSQYGTQFITDQQNGYIRKVSRIRNPSKVIQVSDSFSGGINSFDANQFDPLFLPKSTTTTDTSALCRAGYRHSLRCNILSLAGLVSSSNRIRKSPDMNRARADKLESIW